MPGKNVPYYIKYSNEQITDLFGNLGITERNNILLVIRLFKYIEIKGTPKIKIEGFVSALIKWAEDNNYSSFRHAQNIRRSLSSVLGFLQKKRFCDVTYNGEILETVEFYEAEKNLLNDYYKKIQKDPPHPFPNETNFPLKIPITNLFEFRVEDISKERLEEAFETGKIIKIFISETSSHILITPDHLFNLLPLSIRKIGYYLYPGQKTKALEDVSRLLKGIMPEKTIDADRVKRIFFQEERESPSFFVHAIETLLNVLQNNRDDEKIKQPYEAIYLLKYFKQAEQKDIQENEIKEQQSQDKNTIINIIHKLDVIATVSDLLTIRDGRILNKTLAANDFAKKYSPNEFSELIDEIIRENSAFNEDKEDTHLLPVLVKMVSLSGNVYVCHRDNFIPILENLRTETANEITSILRKRWRNHFLQFKYEAEMKNDLSFDETIRGVIEKRFKALRTVLDNAQVIYNAILDYGSAPTEQNQSVYEIFFNSDKEKTLKPVYQILELDRLKIYRAAYGAQPVHYRFFLTRVVLFFLNLFSSKKPDSNSEDAENTTPSESIINEESSTSGTDSSSSRKKDIKTHMESIKKILSPSANVKASLDSLEREWNQKLGDVREIVREKVDHAVEKRASENLKLFLKARAVSPQFIQKELNNMATSMSISGKYSDITDKKAFKDYIILYAIRHILTKMKV